MESCTTALWFSFKNVLVNGPFGVHEASQEPLRVLRVCYSSFSTFFISMSQLIFPNKSIKPSTNASMRSNR